MRFLRALAQLLGITSKDKPSESEANQRKEPTVVLLEPEKLDELVSLLQLENSQIAGKAESELRKAAAHQADDIITRLIPVSPSLNTRFCLGLLTRDQELFPHIAKHCSAEVVPFLVNSALGEFPKVATEALFGLEDSNAIRTAVSLLAKEVQSDDDVRRGKALALLLGPVEQSSSFFGIRCAQLQAPLPSRRWAEFHPQAIESLRGVLRRGNEEDVKTVMSILEGGMANSLTEFGDSIDSLTEGSSEAVIRAACRSQLLVQKDPQEILRLTRLQIKHVLPRVREQALDLLAQLASNERVAMAEALPLLFDALTQPKLAEFAASAITDAEIEIPAAQAGLLVDLMEKLPTDAELEKLEDPDEEALHAWRLDKLIALHQFDVTSVESLQLLVRLMHASGNTFALALVSDEERYPALRSLAALEAAEPEIVFDTLARGLESGKLNDFFPTLFEQSTDIVFEAYMHQLSNRRRSGNWVASKKAKAAVRVLQKLLSDPQGAGYLRDFLSSEVPKVCSLARRLFLAGPVELIEAELHSRLNPVMKNSEERPANDPEVKFVLDMLCALGESITEFRDEVLSLHKTHSRLSESALAELVQHDPEVRTLLAKQSVS